MPFVACVSLALLGESLVAQETPQGQSGPRLVRRMAPPPPAMTGARADLAMTLTAGLPTITATVNGRGPYRFGVDTGAAGYLRVSPALAEALGLQPVGEAMAGDPSGRNPIRIPVYRIDSLAFGGLTFTGISTTALPQLGPRTAQLDGIIGLGFFEHLLLTIDYGGLMLSAGPGALPAANGRDIVDIAFDRTLISVPLRIGDTVRPVHLDTGNTAQPLFLPADAVATLPTRGEPRVVGRARTVSQEIEIRAVDLAAPVSVGTTRLPVTTVGFPAAAPPGNIGSLALQGLAITIDYANARLRIVPSRR
jgi:hypothetical protein